MPNQSEELATLVCVITVAIQACISHVMLWKNSNNSHADFEVCYSDWGTSIEQVGGLATSSKGLTDGAAVSGLKVTAAE